MGKNGGREAGHERKAMRASKGAGDFCGLWAVGCGPLELKLARGKAVPPPRMSQAASQLWKKCWMWAVAISKGLLPLLKSEVAEGM